MKVKSSQKLLKIDNMKILLMLVILSFNSIACMTGHWEKVGESNSFTIDLAQEGNNLRGKYCFITNNGNRIDCEDEHDNIDGKIKGGIAYIKFESTFGETGTATAKIINNKLVYTIENNNPFIQADMSVPAEIEFSRN